MINYFTPAAVALINTLGEKDKLARLRAGKIIAALGLDMAQSLLHETESIERGDGMLTLDGTRRRTFGGVWFRLAKERMTDEQWLAVFGYARGERASRQREPAGPTEPPFTWIGRRVDLLEAAQGKGDITTVKVQLIGRPKKIVQRADCALIIMQHHGPLPTLPKGIPLPSKVPTTEYIVWIGAKQWRKVKDAIKHPDDMLIVDGAQIYDQEFHAIAVFATNVTTKNLLRQQREAKQAAPGA